VRANYGPLTVKQTIYPSYWTEINSKKNDSYDVSINTNSQPKVYALNGELSAHLVTKEVRRSSPVLRVLFYAGHTSDYSQRARIDFIDKTLCAAIIIEYHGEKLFGICSPSKSREGACLAEVTIPSSYWPPVDTNGLSQKQQKATNAKVYYAITHSEHCTDSTFLATSDQNSLSLNYLSDVSLIPFRGSYEEVTNDNVVTILIPQEPVYPNSKIYIPVKYTYNPEYPIAAFSLRIRVKSGVRILGAQLSHPNKLWQLSVELSPKQTTATVTAFLRDFDLQQDSQSVPEELLENISQEVYSWLIEVDEEVDISEGGRIVWQLLYITDSSSSVKQDFDKESAKLSSRIDIQKDEVLDVLAITKSRQLLNTASLNGRQVSQAMRIYMVSASGRISDITLQSSCHAADESILKVSPSCTSVYLDGSEVRGSQNATILIKYGTFTGQGNFVVWMPKLPLDIRVDDNKLSQVKSWKTPQIKRKQTSSPIEDDSPNQSIEDNSAQTKSSNIRSEFIEGITSSSSFNNYIGCRLRFQQTRVEVFTRFFSTDHNSGREAALLSRRLSIRVTHLLMPYIRVSDPKILILRGNIIEGLNVGRSEVQVISPITGRLMGAKEIRVASDKETLTHLDVKVVAGLELQVKPDESLPNVWMAKTTLLDRLTTQYQEGLLDIKLHFSDSTSIPLSDVSVSDYNLSIDTFNGAVALAPNTGLYPRVIAIGPGHGQLLHLSLELANQCQRKRTQPIAMKSVNVNVDFPTSSLQNDAHNYRKNNGVVIPRNNQTSNNGLQSVSGRDNQFDFIGKTSDEPTLQARHNLHNIHRANTINFEVGIYSFFAIFGIAIIIVAVFYRIFSVKLKYKNPPETITTTRIGPITSTNRPVVANANEWVWLGKATLERNSILTNCAQTLLPQKDFNGNLSANSNTTNINPNKDMSEVENNGIFKTNIRY
jgi:transmembrane protein 132